MDTLLLMLSLVLYSTIHWMSLCPFLLFAFYGVVVIMPFVGKSHSVWGLTQ
jgi:hypothetical protein